ncbi:hypothetical protein L612_003500000230 [Rhodococcus rhodochrous J38]|uniref:Uncharacterized protein n=1 Tax=Rhodococcus rhodochrous J45 TaxID=935266 RepID=A0A562E4J0_RHORH|nr:hypothetical protein L618_002000000250 [Rhodococcus rhodochrous J45]TWH44346.1 hypothetical protein L612_003500000230 [Rhodococcus rhodochrous J38]
MPKAVMYSKIDASKLGEEKCDTRAAGGGARRVCRVADRFARPRCGTTTPLGRPVEPEV